VRNRRLETLTSVLKKAAIDFLSDYYKADPGDEETLSKITVMDSTSVSLLRRLQEPEHEAAWARFVELYAPLIFCWAKTQGLNATDASDLVQEVLTTVVAKLPEFQFDPTKRFRGWLRTVTVNKANDVHRRNAIRPNSGNDPTIQNAVVATEDDLFEEQEYRGFLVNRALELMKSEFRDEVWQACWMQVVEGESAAQVSEKLGISLNVTYLAKSRVLVRLREELDGLMD